MSTIASVAGISRLYLILVPFIAAALGFGVGHVSPHIYIPVWIIHSCLMLLAAWHAGAKALKSQDTAKRQSALTGLFLFLPWVGITLFAGMGAPPATMAGWVATATEQQVRFIILIVVGVLIAVGFSFLHRMQKKAGELSFALPAYTLITIAIPLFILNMVFWGSFLTDCFRLFAKGDPSVRPDWYVPIKDLFYLISVVEIMLIYSATALFAASLKASGLFRSWPAALYILFGIIGTVLAVLPPTVPEPLGSITYIAAVPAFTFLMPYLMGIQLLRLANQ